MPFADTVLLDVSLRDRVIRRRETTPEDGQVEQQELYQSLNEVLSEEQMATLDQLTGDAKARVTVSAELASNVEFGNKAGAMVTISVTCDNSEDAINEVHSIVHPMAKQLVQEDLNEMCEVRDARLRGGAPPPQEGTVGKPPPARSRPKPPGPAGKPEPRKKGKSIPVNKPDFKR